jgi:hypothetical protein
MTTRANLIRDVLFFLKGDLTSNITDPITSSRKTASNFIMTSYPQREVQYPIITIKCSNIEGPRSGMQTTTLNMTLTLEIRVWARNEKEKDTIYTQVLDRLANIQFTASGSVVNDLHDFNALSAIEIDEPGESGIKSRVLQIQYKVYD